MSISQNDSAVIPQSAPAGEILPSLAKQYSHLPTPQSPNDIGRYLQEGTQDSPMAHGAGHNGAQSQRGTYRKPDADLQRIRPPNQSASTQCITPESSPHVSYPHYNTTATPRYIIPPAIQFSTPKQNSGKHENNTSRPSSTEPPRQSSTLSSPFMEKLSVDMNGTKSHSLPANPTAPDNDDTFSRQSHMPQPSQPIEAGSSSQPPDMSSVAGAMERARQTMLEDRSVQLREAEKRRPEYMKRAKRSAAEQDAPSTNQIPMHAVGIMESPQKGRRLTLFQETSEESFEESLMAGGYGRYRTADWVRQPQPMALQMSAASGPSTVVSLLQEVEESPPTEKELKKRKRLEAFKSEGNSSNIKLCAVELEGRGRVLVDLPSDENATTGSPEPSPSKKRLTARRKKKGLDATTGKKNVDEGEKPNWPDEEFPWRLRTEERVELVKSEEEDRLRWIERFLDRDSDDEDEGDSTPGRFVPSYPSSHIGDGAVYTAMGRGKMVPVRVYPQDANSIRRFSDPGDARAAFLSKKSVRALSYRQQKRQRELDNEDHEEVVCICNGKDDGRELVQCDTCQTWYHLECIGIKNISELGREEDPWFCRRCVRSPSPVPRQVPHSEPTFAPTDEQTHTRRPFDASFFPSATHGSPNWVSSKAPRTPTRTSDSAFSWGGESRIAGPATPQHPEQSVRIYSSPFDSAHYDEAPFDPTSTPSRGIKFNTPFTTPKNTAWPSRDNGPSYQTPARSINASAHSASTMSGSHHAMIDHNSSATSNQQHYDRGFTYDDSPIRRMQDVDMDYPEQIFHTPSRSRVGTTPTTYLDESPVVRSLGPQVRSERVQLTLEQQKQRLDPGYEEYV